MKKKLSIILLGVILVFFIIFMIFGITEEKEYELKGTYSWSNVEVVGGGYVPGIIFNESEKDLIYARTDIGGVYRWNTDESIWIPLTDWVSFDEWNLLGCESIATDPIEPNRVYVAAGTYTNDWTDMNGYILRSTNYGDDWEKISLPFKLGGNMPGRSLGERLVIDPNDNSILYLATRTKGLWKSNDYGSIWSKVDGFTSVGDYIAEEDLFGEYGRLGLSWVTFDKNSGSEGKASQTIFVGVCNKEDSEDSSIYVSYNGGNIWLPLEGQPNNGYIPHHGVISNNGNLYITYSNGGGPHDGDKGEVWKYNINSKQWKDVTPVSVDEGACWGYGGLDVDYQNPDTILVTTLNSLWPDGNIYRSIDGGETWDSMWEIYSMTGEKLTKYTKDISEAPWLDWKMESNKESEVEIKIGDMVGDINIDPHNSNRMMYSSSGTIYGTNNLMNWDRYTEHDNKDSDDKVKIEVVAKGIEESVVNDLISPKEGKSHLFSALAGVSGFNHENLIEVPLEIYTNPRLQTTTSIDYAELNQRFMVRVGYAIEEDSSLGYSDDGGKTWKQGTKFDGIEGGTVAMSANGEAILWSPLGENGRVIYSTDNGIDWNESVGVPQYAKVEADRVNPKKFYAVAKGKFYISIDGGATFKKTVARGLPSEGSLEFKAMPGIEGDIWLAGGANYKGSYGLWHSTNSGTTFTKLENIEEADTIGFGKAAPGEEYMTLYTNARINGVRGIFRSDDCGITWDRINDDKHQYGCANKTITGDPRIYGRVYIGTNGRGIIYGDLITENNSKN